MKVTFPSKRLIRTRISREVVSGVGTSVQAVTLPAGPAATINFAIPSETNTVTIINEGPGFVNVNFNADVAFITLALNERLEKIDIADGAIINLSKAVGAAIIVKLLLEG